MKLTEVLMSYKLKIVDGPSKFELMTALFVSVRDGDGFTGLRVTFELENGQKFLTMIHMVREDDDLRRETFTVEGCADHPLPIFSAVYNCRDKTGWLTWLGA